MTDPTTEKPGILPRDVKHTIWLAVGMLTLVLVAAIIGGAASEDGTQIIEMVVGALGELFLILIVAVGSYTFGLFHHNLLESRRQSKLRNAEIQAAVAAIPTPEPKSEEVVPEEAAPEKDAVAEKEKDTDGGPGETTSTGTVDPGTASLTADGQPPESSTDTAGGANDTPPKPTIAKPVTPVTAVKTPPQG